MREVILLICIVMQAATLIWANCKLCELKTRNDFLKAENDALRLYIKDGAPKGVHRYTVPFGDDGSPTFKTWPPYMDFPRNPCAGCVHEGRLSSAFPCDECKRKLNGEHDMYIEKVKE